MCFVPPPAASGPSGHLQRHAGLGVVFNGLFASGLCSTDVSVPPTKSSGDCPAEYIAGPSGRSRAWLPPSLPVHLPSLGTWHLPCSHVGLCAVLGTKPAHASACWDAPPPSSLVQDLLLSMALPSPKLAGHLSVSVTDGALRLMNVCAPSR